MTSAHTLAAQQLTLVLQSVAEAVLATDAQGVVTLLNPAAEKLFHTSVAEAVGQPLVLVHPPLGQWLAHGQAAPTPAPRVFELTLDEKVLSASLLPLRATRQAAVTGWLVLLHDIAHFKQTARWKSEAIQTAAHDLRTPVNLIFGALNFLVESWEDPNPQQQEYLHMIKTGAERIQTLADNVLSVDQIESGGEFTLKPLPLANLVGQVVAEFKLAAAEKNIALEFQPATAEGRILGEESWLQRAVANLLSNALKYTPRGGRVVVRYTVANQQGHVEVTDTGPGIPLAAQVRLFERFYRARTPATKNAPGTGLGLSIVKTIVERHAGRVWVSSEEGRGSTFGFAVPLLAS